MNFIDIKKRLEPYELIDDKLIRLGINGDGGYVVPKKQVDSCNLVLSLGVGGDCSFDIDYSNLNKDSKIIFYDGTVNRIPGADLFRSKDSFSLVKENVTEANVEKILNRDEEYFLKMDIEGGEYSMLAIKNPEETLKECRCITMEVHWLCKESEKFIAFIDMLNRIGFRTVHLHGNVYGGLFMIDRQKVPNMVEITMVRKESVGNKKNVRYPINGLDFSHSRFQKDLDIDWYE